MKKILVLILFAFVAGTYAQTSPFTLSPEKSQSGVYKKKARKWQFYGGFGLSLTNQYFYIEFQPGILYRMTPKFHLGSNLNFNYATRTNYGVRQNIFVYGFDALAIYLPFRQMEMSADYQYLYARIQQNSQWTKRQVPALFIGAGYRTPHAVIGIRYDLLYQENRSLYPSAFMPYIRIYF